MPGGTNSITSSTAQSARLSQRVDSNANSSKYSGRNIKFFAKGSHFKAMSNSVTAKWSSLNFARPNSLRAQFAVSSRQNSGAHNASGGGGAHTQSGHVSVETEVRHSAAFPMFGVNTSNDVEAMEEDTLLAEKFYKDKRPKNVECVPNADRAAFYKAERGEQRGEIGKKALYEAGEGEAKKRDFRKLLKDCVNSIQFTWEKYFGNPVYTMCGQTKAYRETYKVYGKLVKFDDLMDAQKKLLGIPTDVGFNKLAVHVKNGSVIHPYKLLDKLPSDLSIKSIKENDLIEEFSVDKLRDESLPKGWVMAWVEDGNWGATSSPAFESNRVPEVKDMPVHKDLSATE